MSQETARATVFELVGIGGYEVAKLILRDEAVAGRDESVQSS